MHRFRRTSWVRPALLTALLLMPDVAVFPADRETDWVVVVNLSNKTQRLKRAALESMYLRTTRFWTDGTPVLPINLPSRDPVRSSFSEHTLHLDTDALATYWNRQYFQGVLPPLVLQSSAAVRAYVARTHGAIGYLRAADADETVRVLDVDDDG